MAIATANPVNYYEAISTPETMAPESIDAKVFWPPEARSKVPVVIVVPGSAGVAVSHLAHAETLNSLGVAALVIDPFGTRGVTSTIANQTQFSFAASAYDVLAALKALAALPDIDTARIGAQGHSRGGAAVVMAAMRRFADPALGDGPRFKAVYAAYPWSGHQFLDADIGNTRLRAIIGERDDWCACQQVQAHMNAIRLSGGDVSFRLVPDAHHSFDRTTPVVKIDDAAVAPGAPVIFMDAAGRMIDPVTGDASARATDRDFMVAAMKAGFGVTGATMGTKANQAALFREDMAGFWRSALSLD